MNTLQYLENIRRAAMKTHRETYRGWPLQVTARLCSENKDCEDCHYCPLIVVTEQQSIGFRELEVCCDRGYCSVDECVNAGIALAHQFIDCRV
ncbi:hypothetical protein GCM10007205_05420 [Oxalicibacterium flavum]|uniref:Uncharacterized protein n=1 Tax=Oxalicibacterium flavum TaxID=179467 RepID=A0A8J2UJH1_9BURK|nr:hypothetical protein [Oxalicibacterium flavum]GGB99043.1 hypothetical protein GCM10007205_05420 [Oxalicibacterium flavum]